MDEAERAVLLKLLLEPEKNLGLDMEDIRSHGLVTKLWKLLLEQEALDEKKAS